VIPGWTEGMKLVGKGGEVVLWIPAEMAYGPQPRPGIPANSALKFEVTLLDVIPAPAQ
jgi:FKBP-type peptidyl-prolyl cis-trans isomerase FkpA